MRSHKKHTILVVEDDLPLQKAIRFKLDQAGFEVYCARNMEEALGALESDPQKEIIWLDHYLFGKEDGLDFLVKIKAKGSRWNKIPVFVVSNSVNHEKLSSYLELGAEKYFTKAEHPLAEIINDIVSVFEKKK